MVSIVNKSNIEDPKGVILEAPFNNMRDEVAKHPFSWVRLTSRKHHCKPKKRFGNLWQQFSRLPLTTFWAWNQSNANCFAFVVIQCCFSSFLSLSLTLWQLFRHLPWFETTILKPIYDNGFRFESDQHISEFRAPVMIMHAENDRVIPYELGYQLYRSAIETRGKSWGPAEFHRFEGKYGHKFIVKAKSFAATIDQFIRRFKNESY